MRITEAKIRQVIREEILGLLNEIAEAPKSEKIGSITGDQLAMFIKADIATELKKGKYTPEVEKSLLESLTKVKETLKKFLSGDRKSTRLNSSHSSVSRMPSSA